MARHKNKQARQDLVPVRIKTHKDKRGGHPHIIVDDVDDKHVSIDITHDKFKGKNHKNYALEHNPLGGKEQSYMRRQGTVDDKKMYHGERRGEMTKHDYGKAREYGGKAKQKYLDSKKDKKK